MAKYCVSTPGVPHITFDTEAEAEKFLKWATRSDEKASSQSSIKKVFASGVVVDKRLTAAFQKLRKIGYTALENHWCCARCGWSAISDEQADKAVFYHSQDYDQFMELRCGFLVWSGNGQEICDTIVEAGLRVEWDGSVATRILVFL